MITDTSKAGDKTEVKRQKDAQNGAKCTASSDINTVAVPDAGGILSQSNQVISQSIGGRNEDVVGECDGGNNTATSKFPLNVIGNDDKTVDMNDSQKYSIDKVMEHGEDSKNPSIVPTRHPEKKKIVELLCHRRLLLERLVQCRLAAERRLGIQKKSREKESSGSVFNVSVNLGIESIVGKADNCYSDSKTLLTSNNLKNEVSTFRELCNHAIQYRPTRAPEKIASEPSRTNLRNRASVGKKMVAAVATLTSNSGWVSDNSLSNQNHPRLTSLPHKTNHGKMVEAGIACSVGPSNLSIPISSQSVQSSVLNSKNGVIISPTIPDNTLSPYHQVPSVAPIQNVMANASKVKSVTVPGKQVKTKKTNGSLSPYQTQIGTSQKLKRSSSSKNIRGANIIGSSSEIPSPAKMPLHHGLNAEAEHLSWTHHNVHGKMLSTTNLNITNSRVLCPEADKLRVKKRDLEYKLETLFQKKYVALLEEGRDYNERGTGVFTNVVKSTASVRKISKKLVNEVACGGGEYQNFHRKVISRKHIMEMDLEPLIFPERRKTQWDCVLQEMRWLATDFIEERKWKSASARVLSSEVMIKSETKRCHTRLTPLKTTALEISSEFSEIIGDINPAKDLNEKLALHEDKGASVIENSISALGDESSDDQHKGYALKYENPSDDDLNRARSISKLASMIVDEHWDVRMEKDYNPSHDYLYLNRQYRSIYLRHRSLRQDFGLVAQQCESQSAPPAHHGRLTEEDENGDNTSSLAKTGDSLQKEVKKVQTYDSISKELVKRLNFAVDVHSRLERSTGLLESELNKSLKDSGIKLHSNQIEAIRFIEELWKNEGSSSSLISGAVISGPICCGKTLSTGALLWRQRMRGPQLLLCPPESVIRWKHELKRFVGLNVLTLGQHGWAYDVTSLENETSKSLRYKAGDVIVCEFSYIAGLWSKERCQVNQNYGGATNRSYYPSFGTVVIDTRCISINLRSSLGLHDGMGKLGKTKNGKRKKNTSYLSRVEHGPSNIPRNIPLEVISGKWWNDLILSLLKDETKCLLVENNVSIVGGMDDLTPSTEVLSYKVAFLYHQIFRSDHTLALGKRVFSWARKCLAELKEKTKIKRNSQSVQTQLLFPLFEGTKGILMKSLKLVTHSRENAIFNFNGLPDKLFDQKTLMGASLPKWTIRLCPLSESQRGAYEKSCLFIRGAFPFRHRTTMPLFLSYLRKVESERLDSVCLDGISCFGSHLTSAKALLRLRRACFHSDLLGFLKPEYDESELTSIDTFPSQKQRLRDTKCVTSKGNYHHNFGREGHLNSPSQPDLELAKTLSENSSKLRELQSILVKDCGYVSGGKRNYAKSNEARDPKKRQKVLILAALPEVLLLTSIFLNSIGISNELLMSVTFKQGNRCTASHNNSNDSPSFKDAMSSQTNVLNSEDVFQSLLSRSRSTNAWIRCQQAIVRFDKINHMQTDAKPSLDLILSSPATLGSDSLGLCASNADVIISMDEDWSGRGDLHTMSILMKCQRRQHNLNFLRKQRFIKLISKGTCEHVFLTVDCKSECNNSVCAVPMSLASITQSVVDSNGNLVVRNLSKRKDCVDQPEYSGCLLGSNIFRMRDVPLSAILSTNDTILSCCRSKLLPVETRENKESLGKNEPIPAILNDLPKPLKILESIEILRNTLSFGMALTQAESSSIHLDSFNVATFCLDGYIKHPEQKHSSSSCIMNKWGAGSFSGLLLTPSSRDAVSMGIQIYVEQMKELTSFTSVSVDTGHNLSKQPIKIVPSSGKVTKQETNADMKMIDLDHGSTLQPYGISLNPSFLASSLLVYTRRKRNSGAVTPSIVGSRVSELDNALSYENSGQRSPKRKKRILHPNRPNTCKTDRFALCYTQFVQDGHQGRESLLYLPPLFPNSPESVNNGVKEIITSSLHFNSVPSKGKKRKTEEAFANTKKIRKLNTTNSSSVDLSSTMGSSGTNFSGSSVNSSQDNHFPPIAPHTDDTSIDDLVNSATSLFETDFLPDLVVKKEKVEKSKETDRVTIEEESEPVGAGLPHPNNYSAKTYSIGKMNTNSYSYWLDPFEPAFSRTGARSSLCDPEESAALSSLVGAGAFLDSMILYVKVRTSRSYDDQLQHSSIFSSSVPTTFVSQHPTPFSRTQSLPTSSSGFISRTLSTSDLEIRNSVQKKKKKNSSKTSIVSFPRSSSMEVMQTGNFGASIAIGRNLSTRVKDNAISSRNIVGKNRKQGSIFAIITTGAHCGSPSVHLRHKLLNCLQGVVFLNNHSAIIPIKGTSHTLAECPKVLHTMPSKDCTRGITRIPSKSQPNKLSDLVQVPCNVDFGPFSSGYVPQSNKNASLVLSPPRDGINLPMGVKVPRIGKEDHNKTFCSGDKWSSQEDERLKKFSAEFGLNFRITCRVLSWNYGFKLNALETSFDAETIRNNMRSARQCRERWYAIEPHQSSFTNKDICTLTQSSRDQLESKELEFVNKSTIIHPHFSSFVNIEIEKQPSIRTEMTKRTVRLKRGAEKRQKIPFTIPTYSSANSTSKLSVIQSHPSHSQSVKTAVTSLAGSNLVPHRAEMWPLQFLDLAEKQQKHTHAVHEKDSNTKQSSGSSLTQKTQKQGLHHHQRSSGNFPPSNSMHSSNHQKELVKQAARAVALSSHSRSGTNATKNQTSPQPISIVSSSQHQSVPQGSTTYGQNMHPGLSSGMGVSSSANPRLIQLPVPVPFTRQQQPTSHSNNSSTTRP